MSWVALLAGAPPWIALCSGMDTAGGPVEGAIVGAAFWLLIAGGRFWLEWTDGYGNIGALRKRPTPTQQALPAPKSTSGSAGGPQGE